MSNATVLSNVEVLNRALAAFADPARREQYLDLYSEDATLHGYPGVTPGREGIRKFYEEFWAGLPDARVDVQEVIEAGDRLIVRFEVSGTHRGNLVGVAPTGLPVRTHGITILRFRGGKCVERWAATDFLAVLAQVGAWAPGK